MHHPHQLPLILLPFNDGCGSNASNTGTVTVNPSPTVSINPSPLNAAICGSGSVSLTGNGATTYTWSPATGLSATTGTSVTATPTSTTSYTVTGNDGTCTATATQTVAVGAAISVSAVTATPSSVCSGGSSALSATASTSATGYTVGSIAPSAYTPSGTPVVLATGGVATPAPSGNSLDDGYWDNITLPFSFSFFGISYSTVRIATNGNVQFGPVVLTGGNPGNSSWTAQTIPTPAGFLDNFIAGPWIDHDLSTTPFGTLRYFTEGVAPNRHFIVSYENVHVFSSSDNNTSQIILNENGNTIDVLLGGGGLTSTATKAIGVEGPDGTTGTAAPGRNAGTWTTSADEEWRFTPASINYSWSPATFLNNASISNPNASGVTSTTTYTVTASDPTTVACNATGTATVTASPNVTYYQDNDNDNYGNPGVSQVSCTGAPAGYVADNTDCNDNNSAIHPGVTEVCNTVDDNCNGNIDEGVQSTFYADADVDGFGNPSVTTLACSAPAGYVSDNTDCNDGDPSVHSLQTYYADTDGDGFGDLSNPTAVCSSTPPAGYVTNSSDCNDALILYADNDNDGFGAGSPAACGVATNTDCNDNSNTVYPGATEICGNSIDEDCNGTADDGCITFTYYADADGDGFGNPAASITTGSNTPPPGYVSNNLDCDDTQFLYADNDSDGFGAGAPAACGVTNNTDCNDGNGAIHPGATEVCNGLDDNCNGSIDEGLTYTLYYVDADHDTYGSSLDAGTLFCTNPGVGYSINNTDCNDGSATVHPGATELCNGVDDDCNGTADDGTVSPVASFTVGLQPNVSGKCFYTHLYFHSRCRHYYILPMDSEWLTDFRCN